jgi:hypothetical protein
MNLLISARKIPLDGWIAQIWVDAVNRWVDMSGCPVFRNPDDAIIWGKSDAFIRTNQLQGA